MEDIAHNCSSSQVFRAVETVQKFVFSFSQAYSGQAYSGLV